MSAAAAVPGPIREAWQILASSAYILDAEQLTVRDLLAMAVLSDAMDALVQGRDPAEPIAVGEHGPHPPYQAARCALAVLDGYRTNHAPDQVRIARSQRLLRRLLRGPNGEGRGRS